jgi:hypothetical protein
VGAEDLGGFEGDGLVAVPVVTGLEHVNGRVDQPVGSRVVNVTLTCVD